MLNIFRCISMVFYGFFKKDWKISRPSGSKQCGNLGPGKPGHLPGGGHGRKTRGSKSQHVFRFFRQTLWVSFPSILL